MNETTKDEVHVAICPDRSKWFWCVVDMKSLLVFAHGRKDTLEEAEEQMWAQAAIHRIGQRAIQVDEAFARTVRKATWQEEHYEPLGIFVYEYWHDDSENKWESIELDIVKMTARHIVVKELLSNVYFRLDRQTFEKHGEVYRKSNRKRYFNQSYKDKCRADKRRKRAKQLKKKNRKDV